MKKKIFIALALCLFLGTSKVSAATVKSYFPDENFFNCIASISNIDETTDEADFDFEQENYSLECPNKNITDVTGIDKFTNLTAVNLSKNNISEIDLTNNTELKHLYISDNKLTEIDLTKNTELTILDIRNNKLTGIDLSENTNLGTLYIVGNQLLKNIDIVVGEEFSHKDVVKMPSNFQAVLGTNEQYATFSMGKLKGVKAGTEQATLTIKNTKKEFDGPIEDTEFPVTITVTDPNGTAIDTTTTDTTEPTSTPAEEKKTSETTTNPKTGVYGGSIILVVAAAGAYIFMKNKNKYNSVR